MPEYFHLNDLLVVRTFFSGVLGIGLTDDEQFDHTKKVAEALVLHKNTFFEVIQKVSRRVFEDWAKKGIVDLNSESNNLISSINVLCFMGEEIYEKSNEHLLHLLTELERTGTHKATLMASWLPFGPPQQAIKIRKQITEYMKKIVEDRRKNNIKVPTPEIALLIFI